MTPGEFYNAVYSAARDLGANDIQARLAAAQSSEETGFGKSMVGGNLFGIKAGSSYTGPSVTASTEEEYNGNTVRENAKFRAYDDFTGSVKDYLGFIQSNYPDAWNAESFPDAVKGLDTGVYGKYATRGAYKNSVTSIDKKYGGLTYAANPTNVPTPFGPNDPAPDYAAADDVLPMAEPNFTPVDPQYDYASNLSAVPTPEARPEVPGLATAFSDQAPAETATAPFDKVMAPQTQPGEWGVINGVGPVYTPTVNSWADVANAPVVKSPLGSVTASGLLAGTQPMEAQTRAVPMMDLPATADLGLMPGLDAAATVPSGIAPQSVPSSSQSGFQDMAAAGPFGGQYASPESRMGVSEQSLDQSRFAGLGPSVIGMDSSRLASSPKTDRIGQSLAMDDTSRLNPLTGAINPAANTQSFLDPSLPASLGSFPSGILAQREVMPAESAPASLGNFPDAMTAQRGPLTGTNSAEMQALKGHTEYALQKALQDKELTSFPSMNLPASAAIGGVPGMEAKAVANVPATQTAGFLGNPALATPNFNQAMNPSVPAMSMPSVQMAASQMPSVDPTTTGSTTPGLFSPGLMSEASPSLTSTPTNRVLSEQPINQVGFLPSLPSNIDINLSGNIVPAANIAAPPAMETVEVAEQPTVAEQTATVEGPATTPAIEQQQQTQVRAATTPQVTAKQPTTTQNKGMLSGLLSKETAIGGLLGGLTLGPAGGLLGALAGQQVARNGGLASMLSGGSFMAPTTQMAGGISNIASIYGGLQAPGTYAVANNGATITAQPGGYSTYTNSYGVTEAIGPDGKISSYFGGADDKPDEATAA